MWVSEKIFFCNLRLVAAGAFWQFVVDYFILTYLRKRVMFDKIKYVRRNMYSIVYASANLH
jgi:hypothetical protein